MDLKREATGFNNPLLTHNRQSYTEMEEHVKTEQREAFDGGVIEWHN